MAISRQRAYQLAHPEREAARVAVKQALRKGSLIRQACEVCGAGAQAHHRDYSKPLEVQWLCKSHHTKRHTAPAIPLIIPNDGTIKNVMRALGQRGGLARSTAKAASSAENGKKGGRPRKNQSVYDAAEKKRLE